MNPGELALWQGNEIFGEPHMGISSGVWKFPAGGVCLILDHATYMIECEPNEGPDVPMDMTRIFHRGRVGWVASNWLGELPWEP